jgi:hypothetical protein
MPRGFRFRVVMGAIEELPDAQRVVITMRDLAGCSAEEVCGALDVSDGNQRVLLHRARSHVRNALAPNEPSAARDHLRPVVDDLAAELHIGEWEEALRDRYTRMCADRAHELARAASPPLERWEAVIEPSVREGPALLGFVAARIAEEAAGPQAYHAERARQTEWLVEQLGLEG